MKTLTYDIYFNDSEDSNNKGYNMELEEAKYYIAKWNGSGHGYFKDYRGGTVSVVCNQTQETIYETEII